MNSIRNIAAYKFAPLSDLKSLRDRLLGFCKAFGIKGTILLSTEGINLFVAGAPEKIDVLLTEIRSIPGLESLAPKVSHSECQPFSRMLVRIKKEIIAFGVDGIDPARSTSPKLTAKTLKQWLDEGRKITLLDTRNDYEVKLGSFKNALSIGIDHFRDFPAAVRNLPLELKEQPVVMFCTGGIRCEKAGPFMQREGFQNIFQLEGGILKYFEECGSAHYQGECFVFDQRVGLDPSLHETDSTQCFHCLTPLNTEEQNDDRYVPGKSCPYCYQTSQEHTAASIARRHEAIRRLINPLPGSEPYDNFRPLAIPAYCHGSSLIECLTTIFKHVPRAEWERIIASDLLLDSCHQPVSASHTVRSGERYLHKTKGIIEPAVNANIEILHEDEAIIVLNKPAPLPMHPSGRFNRNTLQYLLNRVYYPQKPKPAHRLDANTTGLCLVARTRHFASLLQPQFERGLIKKTYLARVHGTPTEDFFICDAPISPEPGQLGARGIDHLSGLPARTEFTVLERAGDGTALLEARPITGRTNQIRAHLWELGLPICGDPIYLAARKLGTKQTLDPSDPTLCLHAWKIEFIHPVSQIPLEFVAPAPGYLQRRSAVALPPSL